MDRNERTRKLTQSIKSARDKTKESIQICRNILLVDSENRENYHKCFKGVVEPLKEALYLIDSSMKAYDDLSKSENKKLVKNINYGVSQSNIDENKKAAEIRKNNDERRYSAKDGMLKVKQQGMAGSYPGTSSNSVSESRPKLIVGNYIKSESGYLCSTCHESFPTLKEIDTHILEIHKTKLRLCCKKCGETFFYNDMAEHHKLKHSVTSKQQKTTSLNYTDVFKRKEVRSEKEKDSVDKENIFKCATCGDSFAKRILLLLHGYKHLKSTTSAKTVNEHDKHNPTWRDQRNLATNKRKYDEVMNEPEKTYLCKFCDKSFKQRGYLKIHMTIHTGEKPFSCDYCGLRFRLKSTMDKHRRLHTGERPFVCDVCKRTFVQDGDLIVHKRLHSGERPFSCKFCEKKFPSNSNMTKHMKSAHMFKKKPKAIKLKFEQIMEQKRRQREEDLESEREEWENIRNHPERESYSDSDNDEDIKREVDSDSYDDELETEVPTLPTTKKIKRT